MFFEKKKKPLQHALKWSVPEARKTAGIEDVNKAIEVLKAKARFVSGGQFKDIIYSKQFGESVFAYFIVRTDARTGEEKLLFDGYMLEEEEKLNVDVSSSYAIMPNLEKMGYFEVFERSITVWSFVYGILPVNVFSVDGFGDFVEVALPSTKFESARKLAESSALKIFHLIGADENQIVDTDVITLQLSKLIEQQK